jgi:hypothetical protein
MGGLGEGRKTSRVAEEIMMVNISLPQRSNWRFSVSIGVDRSVELFFPF